MSYTYIPQVPENVEPETEAVWWRRYVKELLLTAWALLWLACGMALLTYHPLDPGLSSTGTGDGVFNALGPAGAWWADAMLFIFGHSAWLLWLLWGVLVVRALIALTQPKRQAQAHILFTQDRNTFHKLREPPPAQPATARPFWQRYLPQWLGRSWRRLTSPLMLSLYSLSLFMAGACALEWSRYYRWEASLPDNAGGVLGAALGRLGEQLLGFNGLALLALVIILPTFSWVVGFSWWRVADRTGYALERLWLYVHRKRQIAADERQGVAQVQDREHALQQGASQSNPYETTDEAAGANVAAPSGALPVGIVVKPSVAPSMSDRAQRERQQVLFTAADSMSVPRLDLLDAAPERGYRVTRETLEMTSRLIEKKLKDFGVTVQVQNAAPGPVITRYEIELATGVKGATVVGLSRDLARSLSLTSIRVVETIPGKNTMALELPNPKRQTIALSELLGSSVYNDAKSLLTMALGKDIVGLPVVADLAKMPHCLVAGTTGSGKSVAINAMILSLLYKATPDAVRLLLIDPKMLELSIYEGIPHLLAPVVTNMSEAAHGLNWCVAEMERRYRLMAKMGVRNVAGFNDKIATAKAKGLPIAHPFSLQPDEPEPLEHLPYIVVVIDELADLMMQVGKKVEELIARLAQKARAAGIHLILATQRPSVDVITGLIKANIPTRISFQVSSKIDSRTVLDQQGAEALLGMGDMLYLAPGSGLTQRLHGAFVSDEEVHNVVSFLKAQGEPNYIDGVLDGASADAATNVGGQGDGDGGLAGGGEQDPLYDKVVELVLHSRKASISYVQRHLRIGYNRAATLLESMQNAGLVSSMSHNNQRVVLVPRSDASITDRLDEE